ncbi:phosphate ABC transporter permease [Halobacteriales archaeon QH_2_65_14]|nr:MAG: phosphate ABC transporter permease [Halobacteriales archaeon QH_2_65_14]
MEPIAIALVVGGAVLLFSGAGLSVYGAGLLGAVLGGGGGYLLAPTLAGAVSLDGLAATAAAVVVGAVIGVGVTYVLLSMAIAAMGFVVGTYLGLVAADPVLGDPSLAVTALVALAVGVGVAFLGMFMSRTTMVIITSFVGAALASQSITIETVNDAADAFDPDPLIFDATAPLFLGLFALGILSQFGLFKLGYVTKLAGHLPGASVLKDEKARGA